ncbi:MAG: cellulose biosynthesis cyclic di-GMP-binding regulatory protein BcsB [Tumebacillaceae bacterium]
MRGRGITALLLAGMLLLPSVPARAQDDLQNAFVTAEDRTLTPQTSHYDFFYNVPKQWRVQDAWFEAHFRHSPTLLPQYSSISLLVDGIPYASARLTSDNEGGGTLRAVIPAANLTPGYHQFSVAANLRSQKEVCENPNDPSNWLVLERTSLIHVSFGDSSGAPDVSAFPFPFVQESGPNPWRVDVVVPDAATDGELEAAYRVVANLARAQREQSSTVNVIRAAEWDAGAHPRHVVFVGTVDHLPASLRTQAGQLGQAPANVGLLREATTANGRLALVVTGRSEKEVGLAGDALRYPQLVQQFSGPEANIAEPVLTAAREQVVANPPTYSIAEKGHVSLKQLGYGEVTLSGAQTSSTAYTFRTPPNWKYTKGAGVRLSVRYSQMLDGQRSALIASVNGAPAVSKPMQPGTAQGVDLFVPFPNDLQPGEEVRVTLMAEMYLNTNDCLDNEQTMKRYVTIDPENSEFVLPHVVQHTAALAAFPASFLSSGGELENTTVVLPAAHSSAELTAVARAVAGAADVAEETHLTVRHAGEGDVAGNVWVVDTGGNNSFAKRLADAGDLAARSTPDGLASNTIPLATDTQRGGGIVQQVFRPAGGVALVLAAPQANMLLDTATMLSAKLDIPADSTQAGAIRTTGGQTVLVDIFTEPRLPLNERLANRIAATYGYLTSPQGRVTLYLSAFGVTFLVLAGSIWLTWRRATVPRKVKQRKRKKANR